MRYRMVTSGRTFLACLMLVSGLAGCVTEPAAVPEQGAPPTDLDRETIWASHESGDLAYGARFQIPAGSDCFATLLGRGTASDAGPVIALVISGVADSRSDFIMSGRTSATTDDGIPFVTAGIAGDDVSSDQATYQEMWIHNVSAGFSSGGDVRLFALVRDADPVATSRAASEADRANLTGSALLRLWCDDVATVPDPFQVSGFRLFDMRDMHEGTFVRAQTTSWWHLATAAVDHGFTHTTTDETFLFAQVGPDPEKVARIVLDAPDGVREWFAPPTTYMLQVGDVDMTHQGPAGNYRLTIDGGGASTFFQFNGVLIELESAV